MTELNEAMRKLEIPARMKALRISPEGYPVPFFVAWMAKDGKGKAYEVAPGIGEPDFRIIGGVRIGGVVESKVSYCRRTHRCWLCGDLLGVHKTFVIGPMCAINRVSSEPPSHLDCARFAARACPFLSKPKMRRNEKSLPGSPEERVTPGIPIDRNPGVTLLWTTRRYTYGRDRLFRIGDADAVEWWAEGRTARRAEVEESIKTGMPILQEMAEQDGREAVSALITMAARVEPLLPRASS